MSLFCLRTGAACSPPGLSQLKIVHRQLHSDSIHDDVCQRNYQHRRDVEAPHTAQNPRVSARLLTCRPAQCDALKQTTHGARCCMAGNYFPAMPIATFALPGQPGAHVSLHSLSGSLFRSRVLVSAQQSTMGAQTCSPLASGALQTLPRKPICTLSPSTPRCAACGKAQTMVDRRTAAFFVGPLLVPAAALALVPDQDEEDDKLIQQAKQNRDKRLTGERTTETRYSVTSGANKNGDLGSIQRAINRLGKSGASLEAGKLSEVTSTIRDKWVDQFKTAASELSTSNEASSSLDSLVSGISALGSASEISDAKRTYVTVVRSLQDWVNLVGIANSMKGL